MRKARGVIAFEYEIADTPKPRGLIKMS